MFNVKKCSSVNFEFAMLKFIVCSGSCKKKVMITSSQSPLFLNIVWSCEVFSNTNKFLIFNFFGNFHGFFNLLMRNK